MNHSNKILIFYSFLVMNHLFHNYELNTDGFKQDFSLAAFEATFSLLLQFLLLLIVLIGGYDLYRSGRQAYRRVKWVSIIFLSYGILISIGLVYREENVPGSFSGFIYVMICLPLLLQLSDILRREQEAIVTDKEMDNF